MGWSPWSWDVAFMTSHGSVIRSGVLTTLSTDLSSIGLSVPPPPSLPHLYPRCKNKRGNEAFWMKWNKHVCQKGEGACFCVAKVGVTASFLSHSMCMWFGRCRNMLPSLLLLQWMRGCDHHWWELGSESSKIISRLGWGEGKERWKKKTKRGIKKKVFPNYLMFPFLSLSLNKIQGIPLPRFFFFLSYSFMWVREVTDRRQKGRWFGSDLFSTYMCWVSFLYSMKMYRHNFFKWKNW